MFRALSAVERNYGSRTCLDDLSWKQLVDAGGDVERALAIWLEWQEVIPFPGISPKLAHGCFAVPQRPDGHASWMAGRA